MAGKLTRLWAHLFTAGAESRFPAEAMERIAQAIALGESVHSGEVCFAVEAALPWREVLRDADPRQRGMDAFGRLRVWDTAANNGVLVYLLLAEHAIEIVADRGLARQVPPGTWQALVAAMGDAFRRGDYEGGLTQALSEVSALLARYFPSDGAGSHGNELPDSPVLGRQGG